jgi:small conductance mechanosensitive channel
VTGFAAVIGASALAVGLAFQGSLSNFAAGVMLLVFRPFKVGDVVNVAGQTGKIDEIGLFTTTMDTADNRRLILPNGSVFGAVIENISYHDTRRLDVAVGSEYPADLDRTREVLLRAARSLPTVLADPEPAAVLLELGDSSINWSVRVWVNAADYWPTRDALTRAVKLALDEAGIGIPFPQMDVHLDAPVAGAAAAGA